MSVIAQHKRKIALGLVVLGVLLLVIWGVQSAVAAGSLLRSLQTAQTLLEGDPLATDATAFGTLLHETRRDVVVLRRNLGWLAGMGPAFRWLPKMGVLAGDAPALLAIADSLTQAGVLLWDAVEPAMVAFQAGEPVLEMLPDVFTRLAPDLPRAQSAVTRARTAYATLDVDALPGRLQGPLRQLGALLPLLDDGLALAEIGPSLLGLDSPRTYLLLVLNESELRPGGGFITGVGCASKLERSRRWNLAIVMPPTISLSLIHFRRSRCGSLWG